RRAVSLRIRFEIVLGVRFGVGGIDSGILVALRGLAVALAGLAARGGLLRQPCTLQCFLNTWVRRRHRDYVRAIPGHKPNGLLAGVFALPLDRGTAGLRTERPGFGRQAGDRFDMGLRFLGQRSLLAEPLLDPPRAGIVGGGSETKIAELLREIAQQARGLRYRLKRIEWIVEAPVAGGLQHGLPEAQCAHR